MTLIDWRLCHCVLCLCLYDRVTVFVDLYAVRETYIGLDTSGARVVSPELLGAEFWSADDIDWIDQKGHIDMRRCIHQAVICRTRVKGFIVKDLTSLLVDNIVNLLMIFRVSHASKGVEEVKNRTVLDHEPLTPFEHELCG